MLATLFAAMLAARAESMPAVVLGDEFRPEPVLCVKRSGRFTLVPFTKDAPLPSDLAAVEAEIQNMYAGFIAERGLQHAWFEYDVIPGGQVIFVQEANRGRRDDGTIWKANNDGAYAYHTWRKAPEGWVRDKSFLARSIHAPYSRGDMLLCEGVDRVQFVYDLSSGARAPFSPPYPWSDTHLSGHNTFVVISEKHVLCGELDIDLKPVNVHTLERGVEVLVDNFRTTEIGVLWFCGGRYALIGESWLVDVKAGKVLPTEHDWEVSLEGDAPADMLLFDYGVGYARLAFDCGTATLELGPPFKDLHRLPRNVSVRAILAQEEAMIVLSRGWIPSGWGEWQLRSLRDGSLLRPLGGVYLGHVYP